MLKQYYLLNGWSKTINYSLLENVEKFIEQLPHLTYCGCGGTCICFLSSLYPGSVIKICKKNESVLKSSKSFLNYCDMLKSNDVNILGVNEIIWENENFFIYTQNECSLIYSVNKLILVKILKFVRNLIVKKIKINDLFHKNFGLYLNDVVMYDFHDYCENFDSMENYFVCHLAHLFNMYYRSRLFYGVNLTIDILKQMNYGKNVFPGNVSSLLFNLCEFNYDVGVVLIDQIINSVGREITIKYNDYQYIEISKEGNIMLGNHTLDKFTIVKNFIGLVGMDEFSLIDYGCSIGGIALSVAQMWPRSKVFLNNITRGELVICNKIKKDLLISNAVIENKNIVSDERVYDICLYFAILHHILKNMKFDDVMKMVLRQVGRYAVIELPFGHDALLSTVKNGARLRYEETFCFLENIDVFKEKIEKYFTVRDIIKMDYKNDNLNRYAFVLEKL